MLNIGIVTDYRLNANHNFTPNRLVWDNIVTDYRLNANHNLIKGIMADQLIVTDYRLNANHNDRSQYSLYVPL